MGQRTSECKRWLQSSRAVVLFIVFLSLLLDNLLLTAVVPIIPDYLYKLDVESISCNNRSYSNMAACITTSPKYHVSSNVTKHYNFAQKVLANSIPVHLINENSKVGWLFSARSIVQLVSNPIAGWSTSRVGYSVIMLVGCSSLLASSFLFAFGHSYVSLLFARAVQGIGSASTAVAGMSMVADNYHDDQERSKAMGRALGGIAVGTLFGYPFGSFLYTFIGKTTPFLCIAALTVIDGGLQVLVLQPRKTSTVNKIGTPLTTLFRDYYILVAAGTIMFSTMSMALLEPTVPIWVTETMDIEKWQLGLVFLPDSIGYLIGTNLFGVLSLKAGRWICSAISMVVISICLACIPFSTVISHLILPHFGLGLGLGVIDASVMPHLALLVDTRHVAVYGNVYSIAQIAVCLGYALGPSVGGQLVKTVGFPWLMRGMAIVNLAFCPLCYFLRPPPIDSNEQEAILGESFPIYKYTEANVEDDTSYNYTKLKEVD